MRKLNISLLSAIFVIQFISIEASAPWTFFTYIAGDNSLAYDVNLDIKEMKKGANPNVNILVHSNIRSGNKKIAQKLVITKDKITLAGNEYGLDSGAKITALKAAKWALEAAPSKYLLIDFWNHGSGPLNPTKIKRGVCFDDTTGNYLDDKDVKEILAEIVKIRGKKVDILCFDACLLGSIEGDVTWSEYVNYIISSEQTIPSTGFDYNSILTYLAKNPNDPSAFANEIVNIYRQTYQNESSYTLSAVDASKVNLVAQNVNKVAEILINLLNTDTNQVIRNILAQSISKTQSYDEPTYLDLSDLFTNIHSHTSKLKKHKNPVLIQKLNALLLHGTTLIKSSVINNTFGTALARSKGISIYFPKRSLDPSYAKLDWTASYPNWINLIKKYLGH